MDQGFARKKYSSIKKQKSSIKRTVVMVEEFRENIRRL